jgi:adenylate cyclase
MIPVEEFEAAGLLIDGGPDRLELLRWLESMGLDIDDMRAGAAAHSLSSTAGDRRLVPGERLSRAEAIQRCGLDPDRFDAYSRAIGLVPIIGAPDGEVGYTAEEAAVLTDLGTLAAVFSHDEALSLVRVLGSSLGRIGEAAVSLFLADVESPHISAGESELGLAKKVYEGVGLLDGFTARLDPLLRRHVLQAITRTRQAAADDQRLLLRFAVGFVDLVGFTEHSHGMPVEQLTAFIRDFEGRANDIAVACGARLVKLIGDEAMFIATDPTAACRTAAALTEVFDDDGHDVLPRGGVAFGGVLTRGGDYYGSVVNLASRLVDEAVPQEVLVTGEVVESALTCDFEPAGRRMVKGFPDPVTVWSLRSATSPPRS